MPGWRFSSVQKDHEAFIKEKAVLIGRRETSTRQWKVPRHSPPPPPLMLACRKVLASSHPARAVGRPNDAAFGHEMLLTGPLHKLIFVSTNIHSIKSIASSLRFFFCNITSVCCLPSVTFSEAKLASVSAKYAVSYLSLYDRGPSCIICAY